MGGRLTLGFILSVSMATRPEVLSGHLLPSRFFGVLGCDLKRSGIAGFKV